MASKTKIIAETSYPDTGLAEFSFLHEGKKYKVTPKTGAGDKLRTFYNYVKYVCENKDVSPFAYRGWKNLFEIDRIGGPANPKPTKDLKSTSKNPPPEAEQMSLKLARKLEIIAADLHERGLPRMAEMLKPVALRFRKAWLGPKSIAFFDDIGSADIQPEAAMAILDAFDGGAAKGPQISQVTGIDEPTCIKVIDLAEKHIL